MKMMRTNKKEDVRMPKRVPMSEVKSEVSSEAAPYLTPQQVEQAISTCASLRDKLVIALLFRTGIRAGELLSIEARGINFTDVLILIEAEKQGKRQASKRLVTVDRDTLEMIRDYIKQYHRSRGKLFPISHMTVYRIVRRAFEAIGIDGVLCIASGRVHPPHPHALRHSFGVHWAKTLGEKELRGLQMQMGHSDIRTTMQYLSFSTEDRRQAYDRLWQKNSETQAPEP